VSLETLLQKRGPVGRFNRFLYEFAYSCLRGVVLMFFRPFFRVRRVGPPPSIPDGPVIFCANHASYLDPAFLQLTIPRRVSFVMTNAFYRRSTVRWFFALVRAIPTEAGPLARDSVRKALAVLERGEAIGLFPEGRLSRDGEMGRGQRGVAYLARLAQAPVVPVGIAGSFRAWPRGARWIRRSDIRLAFGLPLPCPAPEPPQTKEDQQAYANEVVAAIAQALALARSRAGGR
jgi:1-acyl-sn-glycerol-3-phosphate acyltransferase